MKSENIITALNDIDPELVEDAVGYKIRGDNSNLIHITINTMHNNMVQRKKYHFKGGNKI